MTLQLGYYGDDFTGATDTLATAARAGLRTLLFLGVPTRAQLDAAGTLHCVGIAGTARSLPTAAMAAEIEPAARLFAALRTPVVHYKTCSTFDSSPTVGSIGAAVAVFRRSIPSPFVPIVGGQPNLDRYCLFGNLFAAVQTGGPVHRIDRHPTMSVHPITPMDEADLRVHLARQGLRRVESIPYLEYARPPHTLDAAITARLASNPDALLFDVGHADHLAPIGRIVWTHAQRAPLIAVGPSSVVQALAAHWQLSPAASAPVSAASGPVFVLAGSLSPVTARQIAAAASFLHVALDAARLAESDAGYIDRTARELANELRAGRNVLAHTARADAARETPSTRIALGSGELLHRVLALAPVPRVGIAGGDTSSHAVKALGIVALSYLGNLAPGAALCLAHAPGARLDGLELMLKGGQMGGVDLFERLIAPAPPS